MNIKDMICNKLMGCDSKTTNLEKTGWYLLSKDAEHLKDYANIPVEDACKLTDIFSWMLKTYNPWGWEAACDTFINDEVFGWAKNKDVSPAYLNLGVNMQLLYEGFIADLAPDKNVSIPDQSSCRFRLFIDPDYAIAGINLIWLADPGTHNIFAFRLFQAERR